MSEHETFSSLTFDDIKFSLKEYVRANSEFTDMDFEGSAISKLIDVLAYNAHQQSFYTNMAHNEAHLDTAEIRSNVASISSMLGYVPGSVSGALVTATVVVTPFDVAIAPNSLTLQKETPFYAVKDGQTLVFSPIEDYAVSLVGGVYTFADVTLKQGRWATMSYVVEGSSIQSYEIPTDKVDVSTLKVNVRNSVTDATTVAFSQHGSLFSQTADSDVYYLRENRKGLYEIEFGDGVLSAGVEDSNIVTLEYMISEGVAGNGVPSLTTITAIGGFSDIAVSIAEKSSGGTDRETIGSIRLNAPLNFAAQGNAVTANDYAVLAKSLYGEVDDAIAWGGEDNDPPRYGYVYLAVKGKGGEGLTAAQKTTLEGLLASRNVASVTPVVEDPEFTQINAACNIRYRPEVLGVGEQEFIASIKKYVDAFSDSELEKFGRNFEFSVFLEFLNNIDPAIVSNTVSLGLQKTFVPTVGVSATYEFKFQSIVAGSVDIRGFTAQGDTASTFYIDDDGNGVLNMWKTSEAGVKTFVQQAGTVSGNEIKLTNFSPSGLLTDNKVTIKVSTTDENILASQKDILSVVSGVIALQVA